MKLRTMTAAVAATTAILVSLSGCSMGSSSGSASLSGSAKDQTLTVWLMKGDLNDETMKAINDKFTKETGAKVNVQKQPWANIVTKVTTALSTSNPPDVIDMGNTQVPGFAASGGLMDLTDQKEDLKAGGTWLGGLEDPATIDGKLYAVPSFGASLVVIYNKKIWSAAGIDTVPTTYDELKADLDKIAAAHSGEKDFSPFYAPGKYWNLGLQFIWGEGSDIAESTNGTWKGTASSATAVKAMNEWKNFQNKYSSVASRTQDESDPNMYQYMADGKAAAILGNSVETVLAKNSKLSIDDFGTFAMPGTNGKAMPSMIAGSDWGVAAKSKNQDLAVKWIKVATSAEIEEQYVYGSTGWLPNTTELVDKVMQSSDFPEYKKGFFEAAMDSKATPGTPGWTTIEGDRSIYDLFGNIASGSMSVEQAAKNFDSHADQVFSEQ